MTKTYHVYEATAAADKSLIFHIQSARNKDSAIERMTDSIGGFMVTEETSTCQTIIAVAKWGKNSFTLGAIANPERIKRKADAAATLDRLPIDETETSQVAEQPPVHLSNTGKRRGRPPVVPVEETARIYRAYIDERGIMAFSSVDFKDIDQARETANTDTQAFVLVSVEKESQRMRIRGTFNAGFKAFGPNRYVTVAELHDKAVKIFNSRRSERVPITDHTKTLPETTGTSEATSEGKNDDQLKVVREKDEAITAPMFYLEHRPQATPSDPLPASPPLKAQPEPHTPPPKNASADLIYDALLGNQRAITTLMIAHVEAQGALRSLDNIVSENERQHGLLETRMTTLKEEQKEAKSKAADKRDELKKITRQIAELLGGHDA